MRQSGSPRWSAGVGNETPEGQDRNGRKTDEPRSQLRPPIDDRVDALDGHQPRQGCGNPGDENDIAQDAKRPGRAGSRCHRDQDETK